MSEYVIETKNLTKQYGTQKSVANLNIHVRRGRIYGLLGRNGAGKTTTMKMLLGLAQPTTGEVLIWGKPLRGNEKKILPRIGSLIEAPGFYPNLTAKENLCIFAALRGVPNSHAIKDALDLVGLPYKDKKLFSQYSLGMKQRLAIALAIMHDPELLILDEPINGLDPIGIAEVRSFIRMKVLTGMFGISGIAPEKGMDDPNGLFVMGMFALGELYDYLDELAVLDVNEGGTGYNIRWIIDPSGYVYEAVTGNRLENVKATVYYKDSETGEAVLWNAEEYDQINPQFTGKDGVYAWDVPAGLWQVIYELEGYETVKSEWMEVPPPRTEVNIAMVSKQAPEAESIHIYEEYAEISFTQYMQPDTINNIIITDSDGKRIAYTAEYSKEETAADGTVYAKNFRLVFASKLTPDAKKYTLSVPETVKNYAGKDVIKTSVEKGCVLKPTLQASTAAAISHGTTDYLDILIENYTGEEQLECTSSFDGIISVGEVTIGKDGKAKAAVTANMPGEADITIKLKGTTEQVVIRVSVDALTEYIAGDLNEDGKMDSSDALFVLKIAAKLITPTGKQQKAGDVNQDGSVNSTDALMILKYAAGLIETF